MRRLLAGVAVLAAVIPVAVRAAEPVDPVCVEVAAGDGWYAVARAFAPAWWVQASQTERDEFTQVVIHGAGKRDVTALPFPNEIVCVNPARIPKPPTPTTTTTSTSSTATTTVAAGACPAPANTPSGPDPWGGCWPGPHNTGVPDGVTLTDYTGTCRITTAGAVIDARRINCATLTIAASNVTVTRSEINGVVVASSGFRIADSTIRVATYGSAGATLLGYGGFTAERVEFDGGNRSVFCEHGCIVVDSWTHGQITVGDAHVSGFRQGQDGVIRHNTLQCDAQQGGCSAPLTGYGDFEPVRNNLIERNLFVSGAAGYCAYGGSSGNNGAKPYGHLAENIRFVENVFQRGPGRRCGVYAPVGDWDGSRPGNQFIGNRWDDGSALTSP